VNSVEIDKSGIGKNRFVHGAEQVESLYLKKKILQASVSFVPFNY